MLVMKCKRKEYGVQIVACWRRKVLSKREFRCFVKMGENYGKHSSGWGRS